MAFSLLVKNTPNKHKTGDVISVNNGDHVYGVLESKSEFIKAGNAPFDWKKPFVIVHVTEGDYLDYLYLTEMHHEYKNEENPEIKTDSYKKYYIKTPAEDTEIYKDLSVDAEIFVNETTLNSFIGSRV